MTATEPPEEGFPEALRPAHAIQYALAAGVPTSRITLSSDSGVPYTQVDRNGRVVGPHMVGPGRILETVRKLVRAGCGWEDAAVFATHSVAALLGLSQKGQRVPGANTDVLVLDSEGVVERVYGCGTLLVDGGRPLVQGSLWGSAMA